MSFVVYSYCKEKTKRTDQQFIASLKLTKGQVMSLPKITFLGAGSGFTAEIIRDVMLIPDLKGGEVCLVDIDPRRLKITATLLEKLASYMREKFGLKWKIKATVNRRSVLRGSDYIINCIEVSGTSCVRADNDIPLKYGIDQCIGDTIGPGGIFKALRTVPAWLEILHDIEKYCPRALVLNYTNPMSIMTLAGVRLTSAQTVGLCHSVQGTSKKMAEIAGVPLQQMAFKCAGINHLAWLTELTHNGRDLYPKIIKRARAEKEIYESDPVRFDMMLNFGAFITESSGHLSEYLPYYRKRPDLIKKYARDGYRGGSSFYADNWPQWRRDRDRQRARLAKDITGMKMERGHEYASDIIEAHHFNRPTVIYASVLNNGLISNLPTDGVVEVATLVDNSGFAPCAFGKLPPQMAAICASHMPVYDLAVQGIINCDREAIYHAMQLDPLSAAVCCPQELRQLTGEMALAQKKYIPTWMSKGLKPIKRARKRISVGGQLRQNRKTRDKGPGAF
jgi:alpha-galactosidase